MELFYVEVGSMAGPIASSMTGLMKSWMDGPMAP